MFKYHSIVLNEDMWAVIIISSNRLDICKPKRLKSLLFFFFFAISPSLQFCCSLYQGLKRLNKRLMKMDKNRTGSAKRWNFYTHINVFLSVFCSSQYFSCQSSFPPSELFKVQALQSSRDPVSTLKVFLCRTGLRKCFL